MHATIWLPRSKLDSKGEYPYRLWCTFEAACVRQRNLPVAIAGAGLSSLQLRVRRWGSLTPALRAIGPAAQLCRLNCLFYLAELVLLANGAIHLALDEQSTRWKGLSSHKGRHLPLSPQLERALLP